jgi:NadR type nicotinamide-nucleotide adenylyltransferase
VLPGPVDHVFASEAYGARLAHELDASFVPVDPARETLHVSGTAIRNDPFSSWRFIPRCVRPYFALRVSIFGPESTGKTTLAKSLAAHYETVMVPEYARLHLERQAGEISEDDIPRIARGQIASEAALARDANRVLVCDTDVLATTIWSENLFGRCPTWMHEEVERHHYDLTLLTDVDVPWEADPVRYLPDDRSGFFARCEAALAANARHVVKLRGPHEERLALAIESIDALMQNGARRA